MNKRQLAVSNEVRWSTDEILVTNGGYRRTIHEVLPAQKAPTIVLRELTA
jgi:hypothetical protein